MRASAGSGSKGERLYDWACLTLPQSEAYDDGAGSAVGRWLQMGRSIEEPEQIAYYRLYQYIFCVLLLSERDDVLNVPSATNTERRVFCELRHDGS